MERHVHKVKVREFQCILHKEISKLKEGEVTEKRHSLKHQSKD